MKLETGEQEMFGCISIKIPSDDMIGVWGNRSSSDSIRVRQYRKQFPICKFPFNVILIENNSKYLWNLNSSRMV